MKILVFSDSHHTMRYMEMAVEQEHPDQVIHLGDHNRDAANLGQLYPMLPILSVNGNCDFDISGKDTVVAEFRGFRFFVTHGHRYGVKGSLLRLELAAKEAAADVVLFGHTHCGICEEYNGLWLLNPGSCSSAGRPSYGIVEIMNGKLNCRLVYFE